MALCLTWHLGRVWRSSPFLGKQPQSPSHVLDPSAAQPRPTTPAVKGKHITGALCPTAAGSLWDNSKSQISWWQLNTPTQNSIFLWEYTSIISNLPLCNRAWTTDSESQNGLVWRDLKDHLVQIPWHGQGHLSQTRVAQSSNSDLENFQLCGRMKWWIKHFFF